MSRSASLPSNLRKGDQATSLISRLLSLGSSLTQYCSDRYGRLKQVKRGLFWKSESIVRISALKHFFATVQMSVIGLGLAQHRAMWV